MSRVTGWLSQTTARITKKVKQLDSGRVFCNDFTTLEATDLNLQFQAI